ncbi:MULTISPECIES: acyl-CoA dehydrogenase family protein [unclassified Chelatococcus]|uniref:acyl-CoA dehydrogenase family protein n=1 Tax=unclassified Chelatococcus TaxID=2638111 RepID=UPI001BCE36BE|nr:MULTISPECIES: acyl-CoA dehydrogenase family protein [unclassified Chelatococcus]MBS7701224.1 acyl-CoA dehydrogenase family protein [Chelatococcus sp. YT9]MBX3557355.1 acyl-CoA dehydrogenase family protein [Chelatococcus sp.]
MAGGFDEFRLGQQFGLTDEQVQLCEHASDYFRATLFPLQQRMDDEEWWPGDIFRDVAGMGYLGTTVPEDYGGQGLDYLSSGLICEVMAYWNPAFAFSWLNADNLVIDNLYRNGNEEQRRRFLPGLCKGDIIGALGMTEPGAGSDALGSMKTSARRAGDHYVVNGSKMFITNGPIADIVLTYARTDPTLGPSKGISALIVEKDTPGFGVAQKLDKMGFRGSPTGELLFEDCKVPVANRVGRENDGHIIMHSGLDLERVMSAMLCIGPARRALDLAIDHAKLRVQFGKPIGSFQMIQAKLAEMYIALESARTFVYRVLDICGSTPETDLGRGRVHRLAAAALFQAAEAGKFVMDEAVQIHGGSGYMRDTEVNRLYRTTKVMEIAAGSQEIRRLIIASDLLKA